MRVSVPKGKNALLPYDKEARDMIAGLNTGDVMHVELAHDRHAAFERLVFACIGRWAKAKGWETENAQVWLQYMIGDFKPIFVDGRLVRVIKSMSRRSMSGRELRDWWAKASQVIVDDLPNLPPATADDKAASNKPATSDRQPAKAN